MSRGKLSTLHIHRHIDMEGMLTSALGNCVPQVWKPLCVVSMILAETSISSKSKLQINISVSLH